MADEEFLYGKTVVSKGKRLDKRYDYEDLERLLHENDLTHGIMGAVLSKQGHYIELSCTSTDVAKEICASGLSDKADGYRIPMRFMIAGKDLQVHFNNVPILLPEEELIRFAQGHNLLVENFERLTMKSINARIGKVILYCEKQSGFEPLPPFFKLGHGRTVGVWHRGQPQVTRTVNTNGLPASREKDGDVWVQPENARAAQLHHDMLFQTEFAQYRADNAMAKLVVYGFAGERDEVRTFIGHEKDMFSEKSCFKYFTVENFTKGKSMTLMGDIQSLELFQNYYLAEQSNNGTFLNLNFDLLGLETAPSDPGDNDTGNSGDRNMKVDGINGGKTQEVRDNGEHLTGLPDSGVIVVEKVEADAPPPPIETDFEMEKGIQDLNEDLKRQQVELAEMDTGNTATQAAAGFTGTFKTKFEALVRVNDASSDGAGQYTEKSEAPTEQLLIEHTPPHDFRNAAVAAAPPPDEVSTVEGEVATVTQVEVVAEGDVTQMEIVAQVESWADGSVNSLDASLMVFDRTASSLSNCSVLSDRTVTPTDDSRKITSQTKRKKSSGSKSGERRVKKAAKSPLINVKVAAELSKEVIKRNAAICTAKTSWGLANATGTTENRDRWFSELTRLHVVRGKVVAPSPLREGMTYEEVKVLTDTAYATFITHMDLGHDNPHGEVYPWLVRHMAYTDQLLQEKHRLAALEGNSTTQME